ncbi:ATPase family gene 2 protein homolog A-like isoform X1 [Palaemon carinicauda]|uniref:ATPase family gene 2 protein homolog A-like isoform X1 n=1 Tax=Palaemon carinicauda TaxID=392227 RepID=UPI0035B69896
MANNNTSKSSKKNKKSSKNPSADLCVKVNFTPSESLKSKTRDKIRSIRSLTVVVLPAVASEQGFQELQFVKISAGDRSQPALLVIDGKIAQNVSIVSESHSDLPFQEGEEITITSPCLRLIAEEVILVPISHKEIGDSPSFTEHLKQQLILKSFVIQTESFLIIQYLSQDIILKVVSIKHFGSDALDCQHVPAECIWQTRMIFESQSRTSDGKKKHEVTFSDVGGYKMEIDNLKQEINRLFSIEKSMVKAVKGILISGPAGCGKSLIGKALKTEYKDKFVSIDLDSTKSKFQGETEMNLRQQFSRAANRAPCIVFIDDLDILCTSRDRGDNSGIVTTLLHLMDGLNTSADGILVIATATKPQTLDAALRRPGRLSFDIYLSVPEESDREDILQKMLDRVPHDISKIDLETTASNTPGYAGGDLHNIMMEAVMHSEGKRLTMPDLEYAVGTVKPVALKDTASVDHKVTFSEICGYDAVKSRLRESLNLSLNHGHVFEHCGLSTPSQYLIFGPPGCGKSFLIMALASEFHLNVIRVKRSTVLGKYFGESEQNLAKIFAKAQESSPCILHFENFEGLAGRSKGEDGGSDVEGRIINHLKVQLDGIVRNDGVLIFAETNRPDLLDKDLIRPGRFHEYCFVSLPEAEDRLDIIKKHLLPATFSNEFSLESLVEESNGFTTAEVIQLCNEIKQLCRRDIEPPDITFSAVEEALELVSPNTSTKMLQKQIKFASIYCS